jgi:hypothetical protein
MELTIDLCTLLAIQMIQSTISCLAAKGRIACEDMHILGKFTMLKNDLQLLIKFSVGAAKFLSLSGSGILL